MPAKWTKKTRNLAQAHLILIEGPCKSPKNPIKMQTKSALLRGRAYR